MRLIDADALSKKWQEVLDEKADEKGTVAYITFELFIDRLKEEPTIEAVPIRWGHWIDGADSFGAKRGKYRVCSFCNICIPRIKEVPDAYWQCCPNCMTKMKK